MSAAEHPEAVETYIAKKVLAARLERVDLRNKADRCGVHCSPFGVIPQWRLIVDLSSPKGKSVNDDISKVMVSQSYMSVDGIMSIILEKERGSLLGKMDIQQACRNILVHPEDRPLLGMEKDGVVYVDMTLPFGLGNALQWIMVRRGASWLDHYIDDFVTMGPQGSQECAENMRIMVRACNNVGMPVETSKTEGPSMVIG